MFDELDKQNAQNTIPPTPFVKGETITPAPAKAEDIFSQVDRTVKPEPFKPKDNNYLTASRTVIPADNGWLKNKGLIIGLLAGSLAIVISGGFLGLKLLVKNKTPIKTEVKKEEVNNNQTGPKVPVVPEAPAPAAKEVNNVVEQPIQPIPTQPVDSDQDGLTDEEEVKFKTNIDNPDTDYDGLTDREEVKVYGTDPLSADTDGDGYADGDEIKNGFNPKGSGKLLDINNHK